MRILWTAAALACLSAPAAAAQPYDGTWNVAIQTKAGSCDPTANYAVTVTEGKVSGPANVSGTRGPVRECPRLDWRCLCERAT